MSIKEFLNKIKKIADNHKLVNFTSIDDVYEIWQGGEIQYPAFNIAVESIQYSDENNMNFLNMVLYYGDRLMQDKSNLVDIHTDSTRTLQSVINNIFKINQVGSIDEYTIELWNQLFNDYLAGGYVRLRIGLLSEVEGCSMDDMPSGTEIYIELNGTYDISEYDIANVNVVDEESKVIIDELTEEVTELTNTNTELTAENNRLTSENDNLNEQVYDLNNEVNDLTNQVTNLNGEVTELNNEVTELTNTNTELTAENNRLTSENDSLNEQINVLDNEVADLTNQVSNLNSEISELQIELTAARNQIVIDNNKILSLESRIAALEMELETERTNLAKAIAERDEAIAQKAELESENIYLHTQLDYTINQINTTRSVTYTENGTYTTENKLGYNNIIIDVPEGKGIESTVFMTLEEYESLEEYDDATLYNIVDNNENLIKQYQGSILVWEKSYDGLAFTAEQDGSTVKYIPSKVTTAEYSFDCKTWYDANNVTVTLDNVGDKVYYRGEITGDQLPWSTDGYAHFELNGLIAASGNIMSLVNEDMPDVIPYNYCFYCLFNGQSSLTSAPELPASTLSKGCYDQLFKSCLNLTTAPVLPAKELKEQCYYYLFFNCRKLNKITTYANSFDVVNCTTYWTTSVASTGTFYNLGVATDIIRDSVDGIPTGWTELISDNEKINEIFDDLTTEITNLNNEINSDREIDIIENQELQTENKLGYNKINVNVPSVETVEITQAEYDALTEYDDYKIYLIIL